MSASAIDLIGVGSPIMDLLAPVPEDFLTQHVAGDKGGMVLVNDAEMSGILAHLPTAPATSTGGSAANATLNATRLGLRTTFLGKLGNCDVAATYRNRFAALGIDTSRFKTGTVPNARSLILTTPDADRTMRTDLGAAMTLSPDEISPADFAGCRHAHIEGYLVFNEALINAVLAAARTAGCTVSMDLASFEVINATRPWIFSQLAEGFDIIFANEDEIRALFEDTTTPYDQLARRLASHGVTAAVKVGKDGAWIARGDELHRIEPVLVDNVVDTNGAGDSWAAGFLSAHLRGKSLAESGRIASHVGAETVKHLGPIIPDEAFAPLKARLG
ncbi:adenosine kinase [Actomonas aquatica]|uniref:Adenosine kinase n=1 Tax=Actomonas aquatica TaxID=2866162 RepID=A0ABZ1C6S2_9BACT|nr:adenosine kinase [Opitutus sp. WL0086]WRQ87107.1 adenosine kinase [Opitutus sp. WL0086]